MATHSHSRPTTAELIAEIASNREVLIAHRAGLHRAANVGDRMQNSFHQHAGLFLGSAAALGLLLSLMPSRRRSGHDDHAHRQETARPGPARRNESRSLVAVIFGLLGKAALDMGKPFVMKMVRDHYAAAASRMAAASNPRDRDVSAS